MNKDLGGGGLELFFVYENGRRLVNCMFHCNALLAVWVTSSLYGILLI